MLRKKSRRVVFNVLFTNILKTPHQVQTTTNVNLKPRKEVIARNTNVDKLYQIYNFIDIVIK